MDRRTSWPWKKKSFEKATSTGNSTSALSKSDGNRGDQNNSARIEYVQVPAESYTHLVEMENHVKDLSEKLSSAQSEITTKDNLVKQHTKVAEEAISGWEKAEAEASALKHHLESVTLLKLTVEDRASHLDGALKECMKQMQDLKEENEQKLQDIIFAKTKQCENMKLDFEEKTVEFEQVLLRSSGENDALSRSLHERSTMLMKISEEKHQADAQIEVLKANIQSCEREIKSLKYEVHVVTDELEIRNEEKNMSLRSVGAVNKQHVEDVKKMTKLEAECQRLRALVRKKLPGPAALAQMRLEVENIGRDYGEIRLQRPSAKSSSPYLGSDLEYSLEHIKQYHKENEFLTTRLLAIEEESKILKQALLERNSELQASRDMLAKTASKLHSIETHTLVPHQQKSPYLRNSNPLFEGPVNQNESNPSLASMSEDGIDEEGSRSDSWAATPIREFSQKGKVNKKNKGDRSSHLDLMDDFLEMEKLAFFPAESNGTSPSGTEGKKKLEISDATSSVDVQMDGVNKQQPDCEQLTSLAFCIDDQSLGKFKCGGNNILLSTLQSRIASAFDSQVPDTETGKVLEVVKRIVQQMHDELPRSSLSVDGASEQKDNLKGIDETTENGFSVEQVNNPSCDAVYAISKELENAVSQIHDFIASLCNEGTTDTQRLPKHLWQRVEEFSLSSNKVLQCEIKLDDYICALSRILSETREVIVNMANRQGDEGGINSIDCIDKVTLLENQHGGLTKEGYSGDCTLISPDPEVIQGSTRSDFELKTKSQKYFEEEFDRLNMEKKNMEMEMARLNETIECTKLQSTEREKHIVELKSQLTQKSNSLENIQLKCMTESYRILESHTQELEIEMNRLRSKVETLANELQHERQNHQDDVARYENLQEQLERNWRCSVCSDHAETDDIKTKQEREVAAAAEMLAECQETILLLGRQLNTMRPPADRTSSSPNAMLRSSYNHPEDMRGPRRYTSSTPPHAMIDRKYPDEFELEEDAASTTMEIGQETPTDGQASHLGPFELEDDAASATGSSNSSKRQKQRSRSASSSSLSSMLGEKQGRSFSRFFVKGKQ